MAYRSRAFIDTLLLKLIPVPLVFSFAVATSKLDEHNLLIDLVDLVRIGLLRFAQSLLGSHHC